VSAPSHDILKAQLNLMPMTAKNTSLPSLKQSEVATFLSSIHLEKYEQTFIDRNLNTLDQILDAPECELKDLPLGHKLKILKQIKVIR